MKNFLKFYSEKFSEFLKADGWLVLTLIVLNLTPILRTFTFWGMMLFKDNFLYELKTVYLGAVVILVLCLTLYFALSNFPRSKKFFQTVILIGFAISFVVDVFLIYTFDITLHSNFIEIAVATNFNEAKEFFQAYVLKPKIIFAIMASIIIFAVMVKKLSSVFKNLSENTLRRLSYHSLIILTPAIISSVYFIFSAFWEVAYTNTILFRNTLNTYIALEIAGSEPEIFATMDSQNEKIISDNSKIPYVVFVLGESATRNHMQIYGYNLENTPLAVERFKRGELFKFNDVIACANGTSIAMKLIFTFSEKEDAPENWYKTPNIFDIVRRAGYHSAWISNQSLVGWRGNLDKIYSERCDEKYFTRVEDRNGREIWTRDFDEILLPIIEDFISRSQEKNFYCIHLYGSHQLYQERYPEKFAKFTATDENKNTDESKKVSAEYDNSILYTDYILDEIFKRFEDKNALIIYISDHGQEVFEGEKNIAGSMPEETESRGMIEIPMLVWTSQKFREMYPEKISALKNAENYPYRTDLLIHTILDLMDIQTESFNPTKSIINEKFDKFRIRIYNNKPYTRDIRAKD